MQIRECSLVVAVMCQYLAVHVRSASQKAHIVFAVTCTWLYVQLPVVLLLTNTAVYLLHLSPK
jgi:uncharacterized membrane protein